MGPYYVAYFPDLSDHTWILDFRKTYDPKADYVKPHITLVNPISEVSVEVLQKNVAQAAEKFEKFKATFRSALLMPEREENGSYGAYIFLVPDEGFSSVLGLRSELYRGELQSFLRLDIPFVPHITIGFLKDLKEAKDLVDSINRTSFSVTMTIDHVSIVEIASSNQDRRIVRSIPLGATTL